MAAPEAQPRHPFGVGGKHGSPAACGRAPRKVFLVFRGYAAPDVNSRANSRVNSRSAGGG